MKGYAITVDYTMSLEEMIAAGRYDSTHPNTTAEHFPVKGEGLVDVDIQLVHFDRVMDSSDEVIREFDKMGLRPASIEELLAFGAKYPDIQRQFPIVALKSVWWLLYSGHNAPYLGRNGRDRVLNLKVFENGCSREHRFAAVRK